MAFQSMRTFKREITDPVELNKVLAANHVVRIAFYDEDEGYPYIVPINYGYDYDLDTGRLVIYVHSAKEGRKINLLAKNNRVCFEIDEYWGIKQTAVACEWGMNYNSIVGVGAISLIPDEDEAAKKHGLDAIMKKHGRFHDLNYRPDVYKRTGLLRLDVAHFTGKRYRDRTGTEEEARQAARRRENTEK